MKRVLSSDGGGIRGVIPALICADSEERTGQKISSLFDLIAGTSTGGILALGLALPPKGLSAAKLVQFYFDKGPHIFSKPLSSLGQKFRPKYDNSELTKAVGEIFGATTLSQACVEVFITAYDIQLRAPAYFSRHGAKQKNRDDLTMGAVAMATSAAPTYFSPYKIRKELYVDGGLAANNPSCVAYAHAKKLWPDEDILLLSIGTGSLSKPLPAIGTKSWGELQWARPVIDCVMDGTSQTTDDFFAQVYSENYVRLQGALAEFTEELDNTTTKAMKGLEAVAKKSASG